MTIGGIVVGTLSDILDVWDRIWPGKETSASELYAEADREELDLSTAMRPSANDLRELEASIDEELSAGFIGREEANRKRAAFYYANIIRAGEDSDQHRAAVKLIGLYERYIKLMKDGKVDEIDFQNVWGKNICTIGIVLGDLIHEHETINPGVHRTFLQYYNSLPCQKIILDAQADVEG